MTVQELFYRIQFHQDESAFNDLYKAYFLKLQGFAYSFLGDKEAGEEIINDIFLKIWLGRDRLDKIRNIQVYLYVSVKNACINHLRAISSKKAHDFQLIDTYYFHLPSDPAQLLIGKELRSEVTNAVNELPPKCKLIFKMVKEDGFSSKEVAEILGLSNKTVFAQLSIAIKKLGDTLLK